MIRVLLRAFFKIVGVTGMGIAAYIIVRWYIFWLAYYFIGNIKISILAGLLTFFMSPIAAIVDLFWHSLATPTVEMGKYFLIYFAAGRILFFIGERFDDNN
ncbi:MAG: hypothetical protein LBD46_08220 [Endomicrobium sp.]|jgi:hypothetical protein|nr:hypothetical protein [Endomicrobium sp.]